jgi:hypothetical protein
MPKVRMEQWAHCLMGSQIVALGEQIMDFNWNILKYTCMKYTNLNQFNPN